MLSQSKELAAAPAEVATEEGHSASGVGDCNPDLKVKVD